MVIHVESRMLWRCLLSIYHLEGDYRTFKYNPYEKKWFLGKLPIGKDLPECLDNLRYWEKKRNER